MKPVIDLVGVVYNAPEEVEAFFKSLKKIKTPYSLTIIDNKSTDDQILPLLSKWNTEVFNDNPWLVERNFILNKHNDGYALACNYGASLGSAPYLALLNTDTQFLSEAVEKIISAFQDAQYKDVAVIGPLTYSERGEITHGGIFLNESTGKAWHRGWMTNISMAREVFTDIQPTITVSGATYFVRRSIWNQMTDCELYQKAAPGAVGGFLPTRHYFEESFFSAHCTHHGYRILYYGQAEMIHSWHRSSVLGGDADKLFSESQGLYNRACEIHGITDAGW